MTRNQLRRALRDFACVIAMGSLGGLAACSRKSAPQAAPESAGPAQCFDVTVENNTKATSALFEAKHCQGGGVTWAAIVKALAKRRGATTQFPEGLSGWNGDVQSITWNDAMVHFSIDEEGDASQVCSDSATFLAAIRLDVKTVNENRTELERAMKEASKTELECDP